MARLFVLVSILSLAAAACGGGGPSDGASSNPASAPSAGSDGVVLQIKASQLSYDVRQARAKVGEQISVRFTNTDQGVAHDVTFGPAPGGPVVTGLPHGHTCFGPCEDSYAFAAPQAGRYLFFCTVHEGMQGELIVEAA